MTTRRIHRGPGTTRRGFTLIEVLIALSVLGVTMAAAFSLFSAGMELREATRERMAFEHDGRLLLGALRDDLANLVPSGPAPLVADDAIVLWRSRPQTAPALPDVGPSEFVVYRWSGSAWQDSLLLRVTVPVAAGTADSAFVHDEFRKWVGMGESDNEADLTLIRDGAGKAFGRSATLAGSSGAWVAYPAIRGFSCAVSAAEGEESESDAAPSTLMLRLSPVPFIETGSRAGRFEMLGRDLELAFRVPTPLEEARPEHGPPPRGIS